MCVRESVFELYAKRAMQWRAFALLDRGWIDSSGGEGKEEGKEGERKQEKEEKKRRRAMDGVCDLPRSIHSLLWLSLFVVAHPARQKAASRLRSPCSSPVSSPFLIFPSTLLNNVSLISPWSSLFFPFRLGPSPADSKSQNPSLSSLRVTD